MNPPYSEQKIWIQKAINEVRQYNASQVWALIPARTDTKLFHELIMPNATNVYFIKGRITFERPHRSHDTCATHPSMLVVFAEPTPQSIAANLHVLDVPVAKRRG